MRVVFCYCQKKNHICHCTKSFYFIPMNKEVIISQLNANYQQFITFITQLSEEDYLYKYADKWNAAQQLGHIVVCVEPLLYVYGKDATWITERFGTTEPRNRSYDTMHDLYIGLLTQGGKAPERFLPPAEIESSRTEQCQKLMTMITTLCQQINAFEEIQLDTLLIPHPLLGNISLREMLYNVIYHVTHHQKAAEEYLALKS